MLSMIHSTSGIGSSAGHSGVKPHCDIDHQQALIRHCTHPLIGIGAISVYASDATPANVASDGTTGFSLTIGAIAASRIGADSYGLQFLAGTHDPIPIFADTSLPPPAIVASSCSSSAPAEC